MNTRPASPAQQAREALGLRLREIRKDAGLTGRALALAIGCHFTKISRIENGAQAASEDNIKAWCHSCDTVDQIPDLIASARAIDSMYVEWRRQTRAGMKRLMLKPVPLYERTRLFRIYEHSAIPGLFQTAAYSAAILEYMIGFLGAPNDLDAAIEARIKRQDIVYSGDRRFVVILEENALRTRIGSLEATIGQLDRLLATISLPRVSLGVIPQAAIRKTFTQVPFWIYDDTMVGVETPTAKLEITQPREVAQYAGMFEHLRQSAVYGIHARALITRAIADLTTDWADNDS